MPELINNSEECKQMLVDVALDLFTKIGYNETTVRMITEKAAIDNRSFYYLFESKEDLLKTVVMHLADSEISAYEGFAARINDPLAKFKAMINHTVTFRIGHELIIGLVKKKNVSVNFMFRELMLEKVTPLLERVLSDGMDCGEMKTVEPRQTAKLIINNMIFIFGSLAGIESDENNSMLNAFYNMTEASLCLKAGTLSALPEADKVSSAV